VSLSGEGRDTRRAPDKQEKAMISNPNLAAQLAREHQRQMLAQASQRRLRHQHACPAPRTPRPAARVARRLAAAIARAGVVAAQAPGAIWPAGPHRLGEPAGQAQTPGRSH
jgi:hypothetical protein